MGGGLIDMQNFGMPSLWLKTRVTSLSGIILHEREEEGHSWTRNAWNAWNGMMLDAPCIGSELVEGHLITQQYNSHTKNNPSASTFVRSTHTLSGSGFFNSTANNSLFGIVVGTSDTPFYSEDYCLYENIDSGIESGRLNYNYQIAPVTTYDSIAKKWTTVHKRIFNNNSGAAIIVRETGLVYNGMGSSGLLGYVLMARDVLETAVEIPVGGQLTVEYSLTTMSFQGCEDKALPAFPALGTAGNGGYYIGWMEGLLTQGIGLYGWAHPQAHYMLIASPIGGHIAACKWADPAVTDGSINDFNYGFENTNQLIAMGAQSPLGQAVQAYRTLTGINDWYVPSLNELKNLLWTNRAVLPAGHEFFNPAVNTWSSTKVTNVASANNINTVGTNTSTAQTSSLASRLVRRIHRGAWVADVV
jgi:hypothetical protein